MSAVAAWLQAVAAFKSPAKRICTLEANRMGNTVYRLIRQSQSLASLSQSQVFDESGGRRVKYIFEAAREVPRTQTSALGQRFC